MSALSSYGLDTGTHDPQWPRDWYRVPATAYCKGLRDGARIGYEQAIGDLIGPFLQSLGVTRDVHFRAAMDRHIRRIESDAERRVWDATAKDTRPGDHPGGPTPWTVTYGGGNG